MSPMNPRLMRPLARRQAPAPGTPSSLLLRFDGNLTDSSPNAVVLTAFNNAAVSTTQSKWGGSSLFLDTDSYLTGAGGESVVNFDGGAGTVEAWVYLTAHVPSGQYGGVVAPLALANGSGLGFGLGHSGGQSVLAATYIDAGAGGAGLLSLEEWHHVAYVVDDDGVTLRYFLDGVLTATFTLTGASDQLGVTVGNILPNALTSFVGYIDDIRVVKGLAVYESDYVPPTSQLSANASVKAPAPYGTFLYSGCVSGDLVGTYADGVGGRYTEIISAGSC